jgi:hypothetical protein
VLEGRERPVALAEGDRRRQHDRARNDEEGEEASDEPQRELRTAVHVPSIASQSVANVPEIVAFCAVPANRIWTPRWVTTNPMSRPS